MLEGVKKYAPLEGYEDLLGDGNFVKKQTTGSLKSDFDIKSRERQAKSLQNFADDSLSEREDEDIYQHYMGKM